MKGIRMTRTSLQVILGLFSLAPLAFAMAGLIRGAAWLSPHAPVAAALDNQFRYYSGVYILVSLLLWSIIPRIETHFRTLAIVCAAIFAGGIGRLISWRTGGLGNDLHLYFMMVELAAPLLLLLAWVVRRTDR